MVAYYVRSSSSSSCYLLLLLLVLLLLHLIPLPQSALLWGIWDLVKFSCIVIIIIRLVELLSLREGPSIVCRVRPVSFVSRSTESKYISTSGYLLVLSWAYVSHCLCYVLNFCFILLCFILFYFRVFPALTCRFQLQFQFSVSVPVYSELFQLLPPSLLFSFFLSQLL